jgi:transcriptional regulator with XRE-family HTH domain
VGRHKTPNQAALRNRLQRAFGERLRRLRRATTVPRRVTQEQLAAALGVTRTTVSNIERGRHRVFLDQVYIAARELGVPLDHLLPSSDEIFLVASSLTAADTELPQGAAEEAAEIAKKIVLSLVKRAESPRLIR